MAAYLVTGGCGFIGSHLVDALRADGHAVRILDDLSTGKRENVPAVDDIVIGDVADVVKQAMAGMDGCFHLAAIASVQRSIEEWALTHRVNLTGTVNVFDAARSAKDGAPVLQELKDDGATDYLIRKVPFRVASLQGYESGMLISWTTDAPEGFTESCLTALRRLAPRLARVMDKRLLREITINVLDTYVGHQAGERILSGEISRGSLHDIDAAILFMDLRGFTALSDRTDGAYMAALLNDYFERIVPPVVDRGGDILKYMGDGVLATFNLEHLNDDMVCMTALNAAIEALENVEAWNAERSALGDPVMGLDFAVHLGRVQFGNVGRATGSTSRSLGLRSTRPAGSRRYATISAAIWSFPRNSPPLRRTARGV